MQRSHAFTFVATFLFVAAVMIFSSLVAGNEQTALNWLLFFGLIGLGVGFMSAARYMNREPSESTSLVPQPVSDNTAVAAASEAPESVDYTDDVDEITTAPGAEGVDEDVPPAAKQPATDEEQRMEAVNEDDLESADERRAQAATGETVADEEQTEEEIPVEELTPAPPVTAEEEAAQDELLEEETDEPDDLTRIEGIGPAMNRALTGQGVDTFAKLSKLSLEEIRATLDEAGQRFAPAAESWAEQASYAAKGDWDGLDALQDRLVAGRYPDDDES